MKSLKMLLLPGVAFGVSAALCAAEVKSTTAPAPEAKAAGADVVAAMNQPKGIPVAEAFAFLPDTVATVGGKAVTKAEFMNFVKAQLPNGEVPGNFPEPMLKQVAPQLIEQFVQEQVIEAAVAASGVTVKLEDAVAKLKADIEKMPKEQRMMIEQVLKAQGKSIDDIVKEQAGNPNFQKMMAFEKLLENSLKDLKAVDPAEIEKFYKEHPEQFKEAGDAAGSVRASHILIKVEEGADEKAWNQAKADIEKIIAELKAGTDFGKLAADKSACPSGKSANGSLGAFEKGQMVPEFEKVAFELKEGEISGPVKTQFGYHVIRRDAAQPGRVIPFAEVKDRLAAALAQQKKAEAARKFVEELMKKADVKILVEAPAAPVAPVAPAAPAAK